MVHPAWQTQRVRWTMAATAAPSRVSCSSRASATRADGPGMSLDDTLGDDGQVGEVRARLAPLVVIEPLRLPPGHRPIGAVRVQLGRLGLEQAVTHERRQPLQRCGRRDGRHLVGGVLVIAVHERLGPDRGQVAGERDDDLVLGCLPRVRRRTVDEGDAVVTLAGSDGDDVDGGFADGG